MYKTFAKKTWAAAGIIGVAGVSSLALAASVFSEDFGGTLAGYASGCERVNHPGEACSSSLDTAVFQSAPQSAHLFGHGSCFSGPFDGVAATLSRSVLLTNGVYVLDYKARHTTRLYAFCGGGTGGETYIEANGVAAPVVGCGVGGSCSTCTSDWASKSVCFKVDSGTADLKIVTNGGDCADVNGWVDDISIHNEAPVFSTASVADQTLRGKCSGGSLAFVLPTATSRCGAATVTCGTVAADSFGPNVVTCTATDALGGTTLANLTINILQPLRVAFRSPLSDDNVADDVRTDADMVNPFTVKETIPHKVKLYDCAGSDVTDSAAVSVKLAVAAGATGISDGAPSLIDSPLDFVGVGSADGRMVLLDAHYQFNLKTSTAKYASGQQFQSLVRVVYTAAPTVLAGQGQDGEGEDARLESR